MLKSHAQSDNEFLLDYSCLTLWENRFENDIGNDYLVSVDGTDLLLNWKPDQHFYSYKYKAPGLCYEIALCIRSSDIVWITETEVVWLYSLQV